MRLPSLRGFGKVPPVRLAVPLSVFLNVAPITELAA